MKRLPKNCFLLSILLLLIISCKEDLIMETLPILNNETQINSSVFQVNPYSLSRMQAAFDSLSLNSTSGLKSTKTKLEATHYYIRYQPSSFEEYEAILADCRIHVFEEPLVMDSIGCMDDTTLTALDYGKKWFYTVVPIDYTFLPIKSEILDELYQPTFVGCDTTHVKSASIDEYYWHELENEAMRQAGYKPEDVHRNDTCKLKWSITGYVPTAIVKVYDDAKSDFVPVAKVKVTVRNLTIFWVSNTGNDGKATFPRYGFSLKYELFFEDIKWNIRDGEVLRAYIEGPTKAGIWEKNIKEGKEEAWATVQRGCSRYHYKDIGGLRRPGPENLKICYYDYENDEGTGVNWGILWQRIISGTISGEIPNIKIWKQSNTYDIFETTVHELGHASHIYLMKSLVQFAQVPIYIYESWASAIEWYISKIEYTELGVPNYNSNGDPGKQQWPIRGSHNYSPLFIDLVDNHNQSCHNGGLSADRCPSGGYFDGANCYMGSVPTGVNAFIYNDNYYYTRINNCCCEQGAYFDGANCWVSQVPEDVVPFIYNNNFYYCAAGNDNYPFDMVSGYTMGDIETKIISNAYGMGSLKDYIKSNRPAGLTDRRIDIWYNFYDERY